MNSRHSAGYDLDGNTGIDFFTALGGSAGAAGLMSISPDVAGNLRSIAASSETSGSGIRPQLKSEI